jgi:hypothetical protein
MLCVLLLIIYNIDEAHRIKKDAEKTWYWGPFHGARGDIRKLAEELWDFGINKFGTHRHWDLINDSYLHLMSIGEAVNK